jgi:hypothetical protein
MAWITCKMDNATCRLTRSRWIAVLCIAIALAGLAAHLAADVTCGSIYLVGMRHVNTAGNAAPGWDLADDLALPIAIQPFGPMTPAYSLISVDLAWSDWSPAPPVRPPL